MNVKCLLPFFFLCSILLVACKKVPVLPNHDPRSKGKRLSRTWILRKSISYLPSTAIDNTRVVVSFDAKGTYRWVIYSDVLGVESATVHHGKWKLIEQQSKLLLEEEVKEMMPKRDTFSIHALNTKHLSLQRYRLRLSDVTSLEFGVDGTED